MVSADYHTGTPSQPNKTSPGGNHNPMVLVGCLAGNVGFMNVEKMVELTDTCVSAQHVADMSADMSATQQKMVSGEVLTMSSQHVGYRYVGNMSTL